MAQFYYALDLKDEPGVIEEYERWHQPENIWPEVVDSLRSMGIDDMQILRCGNRLVMVVEVGPTYRAQDRAAAHDAGHPRVQAWEELMWRFQRPLPFAAIGEKWVPMKSVFALSGVLALRGGKP
jgi:L-rhamnose mutarotase